MNSAAGTRGIVTALCVERVADRTVVTGLNHHFEAGRLAATLCHYGLDTEPHIDAERRSIARLARGVAGRGGSYVIAYAPTQPAALLRTWLTALRRECAGACIVCVHHGASRAAIEPAHVAVVAGDDRSLLATLRITAEVAVDDDPRASSSSTACSPYLSRIVPASAADRVGINVVCGQPGLARPTPIVSEEVRFLERRSSGRQRVTLRGIADRTTELATRELLQALAAIPRRRVQLVAEGELRDLAHDTVRVLVDSGIGLRAVVPTGGGGDVAGHIAAIFDPFVVANLPVELHLLVDPEDDLRAIAHAARAFAPGFTYEFVAPGEPDGRDKIVDATRELAEGSATAPRLVALENQAGASLRQLLCGSRHGVATREGATALLWLDPTPVHADSEWVSAALSLDATVWSLGPRDSDVLGVWDLWPAGEPAATTAVWPFGHDRDVEVVPYASGRNMLPYGPVVLSLTSDEDVRMLIADADEARRTGAFTKAITDPLTDIADGVAFSGPADGATAVQRLVVRDGSVCPGLGALPIGRVGEPLETLVAHARVIQETREQRRGCAGCPISGSCSRDGSLERLLADAAYCEIRRARPWLGLYVALPALLRRMTNFDADTTERGVALRVSGFGGPLFYHDALNEAPSGALGVVEAHGQYVFADATSGKCARITSDLAAIIDGLLASRSLRETAAWFARQRDLAPEDAEATVVHAISRIERAGMGAGLRALTGSSRVRSVAR
jgi:hypothetical protein